MNNINIIQSVKLSFLLLLLTTSLALNSNAQTVKMRTISGMITSTNSEPLIGATVKVKSGNAGTTTNINGEYTLKVEDNNDLILQIAYLGYEQQEIVVGESKTINIILKEASELLDELVVVGYATKKRTDVVGAISSIDTEAFNKGVISTPEQLLQAKVPGVRITSSSGEPGAGVNLTIRGAGSIRSGNSPLYVIDGVALSNEAITPASSNLSGADVPTIAASKNPLSFLNPDDIASIDVLKDASATAIYGSRGSNGVVIITTKKGKAGKANLSYNGYVGTSSIAKKIDVFTPDSVELLTDWQDEILRNTALTHNHNISYSGGSQRANYRTSLSYFNQDGIIDKSALQRLTGRFNTTLFALPGDRLRLDLNLVSSNVVDNGIPRADKSDTSGELITNTLAAASDRTVFGTDNNYSSGSTNPVGLLNAWNDITTTNRTLGNLSAGLDIFEGLKYQFNLGLDRSGAIREQELKPNNLEGINFNDGSYSFANIEANNRLIENFLTYNTLVNNNQFEVLIGHAYQRFEINSFTHSARDIEFQDISALDAPDFALFEIPGSREPSGREISKLESIFGRVNYTWNDQLLVTASLRADGSSKFGANNRWGYFPAVSAAYRLNKIVDSFDDLKVRAGWGQTGNQEIPNKATQETYKVTATGIKLAREANPDLKWEVSTQFNIGADFALSEERLYGSLDYFNKVNTGVLLLVDSEQPAVSQIWKNLNGEIKNQGVELFLGSAIINQNNFNWNVDVNATFTSNEVSFPDGREIPTGELSGRSINGTLTQIIKDGESLGSFFLPEDMKDGSASDAVINGTGIPNFVYGINTYLNYERLDVGLNFSGVNGNKIYNATDNFLLNFGGNISERVAAQEKIPPGESDFFLEDGSFLRLNNLTVGYTFNTETTDWLSNARVYLTGQNLFVLTGYSGYDPEVNTPTAANGVLSYGIDYATYPKARTFLLGVSLSF